MDEREEMRLSDAFLHGNEQSGMELKVQVININYGHNQELMEKCKTLAEYSYFVGKVREYQPKMELKDAVTRVIDECIDAGILEEFLKTRRNEIVNALLTEYDEERVLEDLREESFEDGKAEGEMLKVIDLIIRKIKKGMPPEEIAEFLEEDISVIDQICELFREHPSDYDLEAIYKHLQDMKSV